MVDIDGHEPAEHAPNAVGHEDRIRLRRARLAARRLRSTPRDVGHASAVTDQRFPFVAEDALGSEDHQQHEDQADEDQPHDGDLAVVDEP